MWRSFLARFKRLGLQRRIMVYVALGLLAFIALFAWVGQLAVQQATDFVYRERLLVARTVARQLDNHFIHTRAELEATARSLPTNLTSSNPADAAPALRALRSHWIQFHPSDAGCTILLTDARGKVVWSEPPRDGLLGQDLSAHAGLEQPSELSTATIEQGAALEPFTPPAVVYTAPVHADGYSGFLIAFVEQAHAAAEMETALVVGEPGYQVELIDRAGQVITSYPPGKKTLATAHLALVEELWQANESGVRTHILPNGGHVIAFAPLAQLTWGVVVEQKVDEALLLPRAVQTWFIGVGLVALVGGMSLAWVTTRRVVRPVNALIHASQEIARGNLDHPLDIGGEGEVGTLARSFNDMRRELQQSRREIARWNQELEARVEQRTRELAALVESSHSLTTTLNLDALFQILMLKTRQVFPAAEAAALFLFDPDSEILTVRVSIGLDAEVCKELRLRVGEGIAGRVFESQSSALLPTRDAVRTSRLNVSTGNRLHLRRAVGEREIESALGVPLRVKGARLGALLLYNFSRAGAFAESDVPLLQGLANQAAAAIENAQLYAELERKEMARTQLLEQVIEAQEDERKRIARELHDEFAQTLTALTINLEGAIQHLPAELADLRKRLTETQALTAQTLKETSEWILELRPTALDDLGLVPAIRWYAENRLEPVGTRVNVQAAGHKPRLRPSVETALFRIAQEAVNNIARHAHATAADIRLEQKDGRLIMLVVDDGQGFDPNEILNLKDGTRGIGLLGMRERAALLGGSVTIDSQFGSGTRIRVEVPIDEQDSDSVG